jgi:phosphoglycerate dehydrogenase-like enzyme
MNVLLGFILPNQAWVLPRHFVGQLRRDFPQHTFLEAWDADTLERLLPEADAAFTASIERTAFRRLPRLRWVQSQAAGVGSMMGPDLAASPVIVTSAKGIRARAIAEHVVGVTIALARHLPLAWRRQMEHRWALDELDAVPGLTTLQGRTMGIVGLGSIGVEVARAAAGFGMRVIGSRRRADLAPPEGVAAVLAPDRLDELLRASDVVVLSAPLTPGTKQLIGRDAIESMRPGALLVNVARGKLVDDQALVDALTRGRLGGAALDVFTKEPLEADSPYWELPNVIVTPHVSGAMEDYWTPLVALFSENLRRLEAGQPLVNVVDKQAGY